MTSRRPLAPRVAAEPLLDTKAMATALGVTRQTLMKLIAQGEVHCSRMGREYRFKPGEPDRYFEANAVHRSA